MIFNKIAATLNDEGIPAPGEGTWDVSAVRYILYNETYRGWHRHVAAWAGLAPGNNESAGKHYSGRTTQGSPALRRVLIQAAWAAVRTHDTYLSALYHRLAALSSQSRRPDAPTA